MKKLIMTLCVFMGLATALCAAEIKMPDFSVVDLDGNRVSAADFAGKVLIIDFWATWCPPCREEIPHFVDLYDKYKGKGVEILGISLDQQGPSVVSDFARNNGINYKLAMGDNSVVNQFGGIRGIPTTFIINREGKIIAKYVGYQDEETFEKEIQALL